MKLKTLNILACFGFLAALCGIPGKSEAVLASIKSTGMGGAAVAYPQDSLVVAFNPAGMIAVGNRTDSEIYWVHDRGHSKVTDNAFPIPPPPYPQINVDTNLTRTHDVYGSNFGANAVFNSNCGCWNLNWSLGLAFYNRDYQKTTFSKLQPLFGTSRPGIEYIHEELDTAFAFTLFDCHSLGVSVDWHFTRVKVNGLQNFDNPLFSAHPGHVTNRGYNYAQGVGVTIGYYGQFFDWLSVGVTYRPKTRMHRYTKYDGFFGQHGRIDIPERISGGFALRFSPCWTVSFETEYYRWKPIKALSNPLLPNVLTELLGTDQGAGFGFRNVVNYKVGFDYALTECWVLRAGYAHLETPIRSSQTAANSLIDAVAQDYVTVGFTWYYTPSVELSGFYAHGFKHTLNGVGAIPVPIFGGGNVELKESKNALGFALGWNW